MASPARSQGQGRTPRREKPRRTRSVGSPATSNASGRLTSVLESYKAKNDSFALVLAGRRSILTDNTDIADEPRRRSWWKKLNENSQDVLEILEDNNIVEPNNIIEELDIEVLSQENKNKNYTMDLPESSDGESINSIVLPQRKLFTQKENKPQKNFGEIMGSRDTLTKVNKNTTVSEKTINAGTKELFQNKPRSKPIFPAALLTITPDKTFGDKTKEFTAAEPQTQVRNIFGNRAGTKRKNMFANFIVSESEDEIPDIQPKVFVFPKKSVPLRRGSSQSRGKRESSPGSVTTDIEMDDWKHLPSSTLVEHQLEAMFEGIDSPIKRPKLSKLSETKESEASDKSKRDKSKNKSGIKNKSKTTTEEVIIEPNISMVTRNRSKVLSEENYEERTLTRSTTSQEQIHQSINKSKGNKSKNKSGLKNKSKATSEVINESSKNKSTSKQDTQSNKSTINEKVVTVETNVETDEQNERDDAKKFNKSVNQNNESQQEINKSQDKVNENQDPSDDQIDQSQKVDECEERNTSGKEEEINNESQNIVDGTEEANEHEEDQNDSKADASLEAVDQSEENFEKSEEKMDDSQEGVDKSQEAADHSQPVQNASIKDANEVQEQDASEDEIDHSDKIDEQNDKEVEKNKESIEQSKTSENQDASDNSLSQEAVNESQQDDNANEADESHEVDKSQEEEEEDESDNEVDESQQEQNSSDNEVDQSQDIVEESEEIDEEQAEQTQENDTQSDNDEVDAQSDHGNEDQSDNEDNVEQSDNDALNESQEQESEQSENDANLHYDSEEMEVDNENETNEQTKQESNQKDLTTNKTDQKEISPNTSHDTTGRNRKKDQSPDIIRRENSNQNLSFSTRRNTSLRKTSLIRNLTVRPSIDPRESMGLSDQTNSSAENSGWDSHRTTRKTIRQTFGKDITIRKSLRTLVMEKSAKRQTLADKEASETAKMPLANSTELPEISNMDHDDISNMHQESMHEVSLRTKQTTLEAYLHKIKMDSLERKAKMEEAVRNSIEGMQADNTFKIPARPWFPRKPLKHNKEPPRPPRPPRPPLTHLPDELLVDLHYKPPKRFRPSNAPWITNRLYKFLETKLEKKYDYKARVRSEKLVETIYQFTKELRRQKTASTESVDALKHEMARLEVVKTHFEFYEFFHQFMPREVRVKVVPDVVNKIPLPRRGLFADIDLARPTATIT